MKNRKTASDLAISESTNSRSYTDLKLEKKKPLSTTLLEKSTSIIQTYNALFRKNVYLFGDADSYFKKTLRNYDEIELPTPRRRPRTSKPVEKKRDKKLQLGQGDVSKDKLETESEPYRLTSPSKEDEDVFYSPTSNFDTSSEYTMAEDENEGGPEGGEEDEMAKTEALVKSTNADLDELEEDLDLPKDDGSILKEVEECEAQCMEIYKILSELKTRVSELLSKSDRTRQEDHELETKQKLLNDKMALLEQKTRRIELLVGKTKKPDFDKPYDEDSLPKVVVCGLAENNMPKFIICDDKKRRTNTKKPCSPLTGTSPTCPRSHAPCADPCCQPSPPCNPPPCMPMPCVPPTPCMQPPCLPSPCCPPCLPPPCPSPKVCTPVPCAQPGNPSPCPPIPCPIQLPPPCINVMPQFAKRLSESYDMQERLAQENADLEGKRYQLQEDLLTKDQTVESLQRQLCSLQSELRMVVKENGLLSNKLQQSQCPNMKESPPCTPRLPSTPICPGSPRLPCSPRPPCQPPPPCRSSGDVKKPCGRGLPCPAEEDEQETKKLEKQLNEMESEVRAIQNELSTVRQERLHLEQHRRMLSPMTAPSPPTCNAPPCVPPRDNTQLRELREQYNALQDDYKSKLVEVSGLRADIDMLKKGASEAHESKKLFEEKIRELEKIIKECKANEAKTQFAKEQLTELEQQMSVSKQRFREAQDEMEELRALTEEQQAQLNEYRNKYLEAQQSVEEQKRQIDLMELENNRIGEQVNLEIQRVKNQFQEKLQELTPLPDILKATQMKLQEAQQMHLMAERNNEALLREIQTMRDKAALIADEIDKSKSQQALEEAERQQAIEKVADLEERIAELTEKNDNLEKRVEELTEQYEDAEKRAQEKIHEIVQLTSEVENVREESARQVARTKDRCETIRRSMQNQVADLEKQLAQSRAAAKAAQKDRDEIRQKMQSQINNLNENFEDAQMRIRTLQGHVNFLKTSASVYPSIDQLPTTRN